MARAWDDAHWPMKRLLDGYERSSAGTGVVWRHIGQHKVLRRTGRRVRGEVDDPL